MALALSLHRTCLGWLQMKHPDTLLNVGLVFFVEQLAPVSKTTLSPEEERNISQH